MKRKNTTELSRAKSLAEPTVPQPLNEGNSVQPQHSRRVVENDGDSRNPTVLTDSRKEVEGEMGLEEKLQKIVDCKHTLIFEQAFVKKMINIIQERAEKSNDHQDQTPEKVDFKVMLKHVTPQSNEVDVLSYGKDSSTAKHLADMDINALIHCAFTRHFDQSVMDVPVENIDLTIKRLFHKLTGKIDPQPLKKRLVWSASCEAWVLLDYQLFDAKYESLGMCSYQKLISNQMENMVSGEIKHIDHLEGKEKIDHISRNKFCKEFNMAAEYADLADFDPCA